MTSLALRWSNLKVTCFFVLCCLCSSAWANKEAVNQVLDGFHQAASEADQKAYFALFHEQGIFLGTDATERWTKADFEDFARPYFRQGIGWSYYPRARHLYFSQDQKTAWFDELLDHDTYGECRGTGVLVLTDDGWKIIQYHLTFPIPNEVVDSVIERIKQATKQK